MDATEMQVEEGCAVTCQKCKYDRSIEGLIKQLAD